MDLQLSVEEAISTVYSELEKYTGLLLCLLFNSPPLTIAYDHQ